MKNQKLIDNFNQWNEVKKQTQKASFILSIKPREIYWVKIGQNIGSEEYGKGKIFSRPVLVVRQLTSDLFVGIPLTSTIRDDDYFYSFSFQTKKATIKNSAMLLQIRTFSKKRITDKLGKVNTDDFKQIEKRVIKMLFPPKD